MHQETKCSDLVLVKGATDFSIAAIMGKQSSITENSKRKSKLTFKANE